MDDFDRLVARLTRLPAAARVGALDEVNAQKLAYSEFGTVREPPRPALSAATDQNAAALHRAVARRVGDVIDGRSATGESILSAVAADLAEEVRNTIDSNVQPPLAPSTLAARRRRGNASNRTLVDTGEMLRAITYEAKQGAGDWADE